MLVELICSDCDDKPICPSLWRTDRGTAIAPGWDTGRDDTVEVPASLLVGVPGIAGEVTARGTVLVRGARVADAGVEDGVAFGLVEVWVWGVGVGRVAVWSGVPGFGECPADGGAGG